MAPRTGGTQKLSQKGPLEYSSLKKERREKRNGSGAKVARRKSDCRCYCSTAAAQSAAQIKINCYMNRTQADKQRS